MATIVFITATTVTEADRSAANALDGMIEAQDHLGQITWDTISHSVAVGTFVTTDSIAGQGFTALGRTRQSVAVFDLDLADGMDVIRVTNYVNNGGDFPELRAEQGR